MQKTRLSNAKGFSLVEVLIVLGILSFLSAMMIVAITGARRIGTTAQAQSVAQQKNRYIHNIMERDFRLAGVGIYEEVYKNKNGGNVAGELTGHDLPDQFDYSLGDAELAGYMIPPLEITNGTDTTITSYFNPLESMLGLTSAFREPGTDIVTVYQKSFHGFEANITSYTGQGQEFFEVGDMDVGERLLQLFNKMGGNPIMVYVVDEGGMYATMRVVTDIKKDANSYNIKMSPSNDTNQPTNMKGFLESLGYNFNGNPDLLRQMVSGDNFSQVSSVSYFVYTHPDPAMGARGWLVRLDMPAIVAGGLNIDANDPETLRPFVISENVADFQVAVAIDSDANGLIDAAEWHNGEDLETYIHANPDGTTVPAEYVDFVNNLKEIRYSIVTYTDETAANDRIGFADPDSSNFSTLYPDAAAVASMIGITPTLEDRIWDKDALVQRLWYHRAVQLTKSAVIRNLDLENTFAREQ